MGTARPGLELRGLATGPHPPRAKYPQPCPTGRFKGTDASSGMSKPGLVPDTGQQCPRWPSAATPDRRQEALSRLSTPVLKGRVEYAVAMNIHQAAAFAGKLGVHRHTVKGWSLSGRQSYMVAWLALPRGISGGRSRRRRQRCA